jgi:hypothetical protein
MQEIVSLTSETCHNKSVKVASPPRQVSQFETEAQDLPLIKTFQSKGHPSSVSPKNTEQTMADWTGAVKGDAKMDNTESNPIGSNAIIKTILCRQNVPDQAFGRQVGIRYHGRPCKVIGQQPIRLSLL